MNKICVICKNNFNGTGKTCSRTCASTLSHKERKYVPYKKRINLICKNCGESFEIVPCDSNREFCSKSCVTQYKWKDTKYREFMSNAIKNKWDDIQYQNHMANVLYERWSDINYKNKLSEKYKETWANPEYKMEMSDKHKNAWSDAEFKKMMVNSLLNSWTDPTVAEKRLHKCFRYKEYSMPSGRIVKLQGYEPQVLTELLKTYSEDDIIIGIKEMNTEVGRLQYTFNGTQHTYYPDFYIKSTNTIIEVKSTYTWNIAKEKNLVKEQACLQQGFNFEFIIL